MGLQLGILLSLPLFKGLGHSEPEIREPFPEVGLTVALDL